MDVVGLRIRETQESALYRFFEERTPFAERKVQRTRIKSVIQKARRSRKKEKEVVDKPTKTAESFECLEGTQMFFKDDLFDSLRFAILSIPIQKITSSIRMFQKSHTLQKKQVANSHELAVCGFVPISVFFPIKCYWELWKKKPLLGPQWVRKTKKSGWVQRFLIRRILWR